MIFKKVALIGACILMLAACGNNDDSAKDSDSGSTKDSEYTSQNNSINHGVENTKQNTEAEDEDSSKNTSEDQAASNSTSSKSDDQIGFTLNDDGTVDEAKNIPQAEKKAILAAFNEYIDAFSSKDIDRYADTISKDPRGFDYDEEMDYIKKLFKDYNIKREAKDVIIQKYKKDYAEVYAKIDNIVKQEDTSFNQPVRQVTVFAKQDGKWGVTAIRIMGVKE